MGYLKDINELRIQVLSLSADPAFRAKYEDASEDELVSVLELNGFTVDRA